jgi:hypothetical protein
MKPVIKALCAMIFGAAMLAGCGGTMEAEDGLAEPITDQEEQIMAADESEIKSAAGGTTDLCDTDYCVCAKACRSMCGSTTNSCFKACVADC